LYTAAGIACAELLGHDHVNASPLAIKLDNTIRQREKREIIPLPNVHTGMEAITNLSNKNIASHHALATKLLHAPSLGIGVTPISTGTLSFFMRHHMPREIKTP
tara:strand:- start:236 stop:547 length:312 start_codon:yes stop_codon:yes gene_type:complete